VRDSARSVLMARWNKWQAPLAADAEQEGNVDRVKREQQCLGQVCPWCTLDARHGSWPAAVHRAAEYRRHLDELNSESASKHGDQILHHALMWCADICGTVCPPLAPRRTGVDTMAPAMASSSSSAAEWTPAALGPATRRQPPPPPPAPTAMHTGVTQGASVGAPPGIALQPLLDEEGIPIPGHLSDQWQFECWTGKSCKWVPYAEKDQQRLRAAYNSEGGIVQVDVFGTSMQVSVTHNDMWQKNPMSEGPQRKLRLVPLGGWPY
jgi:hypothetical protein